MANTYPASFPNYTGNETLAAAEHAQNHNAIMEKLGVNNSADVDSVDYRVNSLEGTIVSVQAAIAAFAAIDTAALLATASEEATALAVAL